MMMRGIEKQHSSAIMSSMLGVFRERKTRDEFLALIHARNTPFKQRPSADESAFRRFGWVAR
jgi:hypothetical protein